MAKKQTDDELSIRRKARRRLSGAVALTLAVVVILPMVLDSEPRPTGQDIELRIPAPDKVGEFVPGVAVSEMAGASPFAASAAEAASAPLAAFADEKTGEATSHSTRSANNTDQVAGYRLSDEKLLSGHPKNDSQVAGYVAVSGVAQVKPAAALAPSVAAPGKQPVTASNPKIEAPGKDQPAADKQAESKAADKPANIESYVAQVGAYSNADTAKQELNKLKKWGFKAYTEKAGGKIRVRVGPYTERDKAEKARQLLEKHGLHPVVTSAQ